MSRPGPAAGVFLSTLLTLLVIDSAAAQPAVSTTAKGLNLAGQKLPAPFQPRVLNLGLASWEPLLADGLVAFRVQELEQGNSDLNGDLDVDDWVIHVFDAYTGRTTNLGLDAMSSWIYPYVGGRRVAFAVREANQGNTDLNGDGDRIDRVLHLYDATDGSVTNLSLAIDTPVGSPQMILFPVVESDHGSTDLNGDGDTYDRVLHVFDTSDGTVTNLGLAAETYPDLLAEGRYAAFVVDEDAQGTVDLNGDGDAFDEVMFVYDVVTDTTTNLQLALPTIPEMMLKSGWLAFLVQENVQGGTDLNGDGDLGDRVIHVHEMATGVTTSIGLASATEIDVADGKLLYSVNESMQFYADLNGDGDRSDSVFHVTDLTTFVTTPFTLPTQRYTVMGDGRLGLFLVHENGHGKTDLNGDGDIADLMLYAYDAQTDAVSALGLAVQSSTSEVVDGFGVFGVSESSHAATDLNDDGDASDIVFHTYRPSWATAKNLGLAGIQAYRFRRVAPRFVLATVSESNQGVDLNDDGDQSDHVLHLLDDYLPTPRNTGLASEYVKAEAGWAAFRVSEASQANQDRNGDGDTADRVLHVVLLP